MNLLLVAATIAEIAPLMDYLKANWQRQSENQFLQKDHRLHILMTGVGMVATTYALTRLLQQEKFDCAIQAGIAGSFDKNIPLTEVVMITTEMFGDLGAEDHYHFLDVYELGLADENQFPFQNKQLVALAHPLLKRLKLRKVSSLSINAVSGSAFTATARHEKYGCTIESMEGAAFHYVCLKENIPFAQIRAISNYVEARDKSKWKIDDAIKNLNLQLIDFINNL